MGETKPIGGVKASNSEENSITAPGQDSEKSSVLLVKPEHIARVLPEKKE